MPDTALDIRAGDPSVVPGRYWHALDDGRLQCDLCPRHCRIGEGQRGLCFVRGVHEGRMVLTTYGRSSGFCIDPIEKKPLNHFLPGTPVLSFGTAGCNLTCSFCQNHDISKSRQMDTLADRAMPETLAAAARKLGCRSLAYTYNDPVIFLEYAVDTALACRNAGIANVAVTAGYITPQARDEFYRHMDAANIDLKAFSEDFYRKLTGARLADVLDTLLYLATETSVWFEITTLLIPDENDSPAEIERMSRWIVDNLGPGVPVHFTAFHPDYRMLDKTSTPHETLTRARAIARAQGLEYVYVGNVHDFDAQSTWCPGCGALLIGRDWHRLSHWALDAAGACTACGHQVPGVFEARPGSWGRKRRPVRLGDVA